MFKRRTLTLCAVVCAMVTIIGAGFSAWVFSSQRRGDVNVGVEIEYATSFGEIEVDSAVFTLKLDQGNKADDRTVGITLLKQLQAGATKWTDTSKIGAKWNISAPSYEDAIPEYYINIYIKSNTLGKYVEINTALSGDHGFTSNSSVSGDGEHKHEGYTVYQKKLAVGTEVTPGTATANYYNVDIQFTIPDGLFVYKDGKKPTTFQLYQDMVSTIKGDVNVNDVKPGVVYSTDAGKDIIIEFVVVNTK